MTVAPESLYHRRVLQLLDWNFFPKITPKPSEALHTYSLLYHCLLWSLPYGVHVHIIWFLCDLCTTWSIHWSHCAGGNFLTIHFCSIMSYNRRVLLRYTTIYSIGLCTRLVLGIHQLTYSISVWYMFMMTANNKFAYILLKRGLSLRYLISKIRLNSEWSFYGSELLRLFPSENSGISRPKNCNRMPNFRSFISSFDTE